MSTPLTSQQVPTNSILDQFNKQGYLGNSYSLTYSKNLSTTAETPLVLISNPIPAGQTYPNQKAIFYNLRKFASDLQQVLISIYLNPTVTSVGTLFTPVNLRPASTNTSIANCYVNGQFTVSANGTLTGQVGCPSNFYVTLESSLMFIIDPGTSVLLTGKALTANTNLYTQSSWYEL